MKKGLWAFSLCLVVGFGARTQTYSPPPSANSPLPTATGGEERMGILDLPDGSKFQTTLYGLKVIGQLPADHKLPYYVLSGVGCEECDANISIYIHSPSDGPMKNEGLQQRFDYPGRELSREDRSVISRTRTFLGNCSAGYPDAVIWFERSMGEDKDWHEGVFVAEVKNDHLVATAPKINVPRLASAEDAIRRSSCREIPGLDQWQEP